MWTFQYSWIQGTSLEQSDFQSGAAALPLAPNSTAQPPTFTSKHHLLQVKAQEKAFTDEKHVLAWGLSAWHMPKEKNESAW